MGGGGYVFHKGDGKLYFFASGCIFAKSCDHLFISPILPTQIFILKKLHPTQYSNGGPLCSRPWQDLMESNIGYCFVPAVVRLTCPRNRIHTADKRSTSATVQWDRDDFTVIATRPIT